MDGLDAWFYYGTPAGFILGLNLRSYKDAKDWIESHPSTDITFYERKFQEGNLALRIIDLISLPGRKLAYMSKK